MPYMVVKAAALEASGKDAQEKHAPDMEHETTPEGLLQEGLNWFEANGWILQHVIPTLPNLDEEGAVMTPHSASFVFFQATEDLQRRAAVSE